MAAADIETAEALLRHAVVYRQLPEIEPRIAAFCSTADLELNALSAGSERHKTLLLHVLEVLEWTRLMLCAVRASAAARLERAELMDRYLGTQTAAPQPDARFEA